jgi:succinate dehydrogenase/fumarate reductase flavoprotein subunit
VTVDETSILSIEIGENQETPGIGTTGLEIMANRIKEFNTTGVDAVTGATMSSAALRVAVTECLRQAGAPASMFDAPSVEKNAVQTVDTDVLVIGSGAAGLSAAITAAQGGAKVTLIEKQDIIGGNTLLSAGIVYAALDEADVPKMVDYYMERANGNASREMLTYFAENSLDTIAFLEDAGVQWMFTAPAGTAPEPRARFSVGFTGLTLIDALVAKAQSLGVTIMTGVTGTELIQDGGAVVGAKAASSNGDYVFNAGAVILATGGFDASVEMKQQYAPDSANDFPLSNKGNVGEGLAMGIAAGADTVFKGGMIGFICVDATLSHSGQNALAFASKCFVKKDGSFLGLHIDYPISHTLIKKSGEALVYGLMDAAESEDGTNPNGEAEVALERGFKADSIEALAAAAGMDAAKLADAAEQAGLTTAPFYAIEARPTTIGSMGGLKTDTSAQVLNKQGNPIPGLYAAGEVANGEFYETEYPASGSSISLALTFGREAGKNAAAFVGR